MTLVLVTAPTLEPVTLGEAKDHLRIEGTDDDALLDVLIVAARTQAENMLGRALVTQTWKLVLDCFPRCIRLPMGQLQSVTSVKYLDDSGAEQTLATSTYRVLGVGSEGEGRIELDYGQTWPSTYPVSEAVRSTYVVGYGDPEDVPQPIKQAILLLVHHWYQERRPVGVAQLAEMPFQVSALLMPYKIWSFGA